MRIVRGEDSLGVVFNPNRISDVYPIPEAFAMVGVDPGSLRARSLLRQVAVCEDESGEACVSYPEIILLQTRILLGEALLADCLKPKPPADLPADVVAELESL